MTRSHSGDSLADLSTALASIDWSDRAEAHARAADVFNTSGAERLIGDLRSDLPDAIDVSRSVEKTTHYKWFLGGPPDGSFELWLHEYKPRALRRDGHATVAHNHRFWLSSIVLRGGFTDTRYEVDETSASLLREIASRTLTPDETMILDADEIHSLSALEDGTITLVAQSAPIRPYSEVFEGGVKNVYFDLEAKLTDLRESLCRE
jgi:hypothetical protein